MNRAPAAIPTALDDTAWPIAGEYARALLDLLPSDDAAEAAAETLAALSELLDRQTSFAFLLTQAPMGRDERFGLVRRVFGGRVGEPVESFLAVLARNGRLVLLVAIARWFRSLLDRRQGKVPVEVTTAAPLDPQQREWLIEQLRQTVAAEPVLTPRVDPDLLGGMIVRIGDRVYDASVAKELDELRATLRRRLRRGR